MNRLVLIGNGFDLAHGMKTSYTDFIISMLTEAYEGAEASLSTGYRYEENPLLALDFAGTHFINKVPISSVLKYCMSHSMQPLLQSQRSILLDELGSYNNSFSANYSTLLREILSNVNRNWVDIENRYYLLLKDSVRGDKLGSSKYHITPSELNRDFAYLIKYLQDYLLALPNPPKLLKLGRTIHEQFVKEDFVDFDDEQSLDPESVLLLDFNYTPTTNLYCNEPNTKLIKIHGELNAINNRIIFGFGDELDEDYRLLENARDNEPLKYVKSFGYFRNQNYHDLLRFVNSGDYQIYVMGQSCGLSDRTMLSKLFNHEKCKSIKIFYHQIDVKEDNFLELTQNISRHFSDKELLRERLVSYDNSRPMT